MIYLVDSAIQRLNNRGQIKNKRQQGITNIPWSDMNPWTNMNVSKNVFPVCMYTVSPRFISLWLFSKKPFGPRYLTGV